MANNLMNPLDLATQLQLPLAGTMEAPGGDSPGANPFEFAVHPPLDNTQTDMAVHTPDTVPGPGPLTPPPAAPVDTTATAPVAAPQAPMPDVPPVDPRSVISLPAQPSQGTAPAPAAQSGWSGAPVIAPEPVPSGGEFVVHPPHIPLLPKPDPTEAPVSWADRAKAAYDTVKTAATGLVEDGAQGATAALQMFGEATGQMNIPEGETSLSRNWDGSLRTPEQIDAAQRGFAMIATAFIPEAKGAELAADAVPPSIKAKGLAWIANHAANGAAAGLGYGALVSKTTSLKDEAVSMADNAISFAWQVPIFAGVFKGLGMAGKAGVEASGIGPLVADALSRTGRDATFILKSAAAKVDNLMQQIREEGSDPKLLPADVKDRMIAQAINEAHANPPQSNLGVQNGPAVGPTKKAFVAPSMTPKAPVGDLNLGDPLFTGAPKGGTMPEMTAPRDVNLDLPPGDGGTMPDMTPPREPVLPDPGHEHQERIATGVYRNPDGTIQAFGYRGVSPVEATWKDNLAFENQTPGGKRMRSPTEPGQMGAISISPHDTFAQGFGDLHYMEANFDNPLVIDNWHQSISKGVEKLASHFDTNMLDPGRIQNGGPTFEGKKIGFLGDRQPGVIWAARQLGHDGIIVRHGEESVEIVALHPSKVRSSGAADYAASNNSLADKTPVASTPEQQLIKDRASTLQNGVRDLGKSSTDLRGATPEVMNSHVQSMIDQHMKVQQAPSLYDVKQTLKPGEDLHQQYDLAKLKQQEGLWKLDGRTYQADVVPTTPEDPRYINANPNVKLQIKDVTGQAGIDPTVSPDAAKMAIAYDGIAKGMSIPDIAKQLDLSHQEITQKLLSYEPNPAEYGKISLKDRNVRTLLSAMDAIESGSMDDALHQLTQPREIEFPELSGDKSTGPPKTARDYKLNEESAMAPDGRILNETVDEHLRHAQQFKNFGDLEEAARRTKWAFEKDPVEAERLVRENPGKYDMPNPVQIQNNRSILTPEGAAEYMRLHQKLAELREPFRQAMSIGDRPEARRLLDETNAVRAQMSANRAAAIQQKWGGEAAGLSYPGVNEAQPFNFKEWNAGKKTDYTKIEDEKAASRKANMNLEDRRIPFQVGHVSVPPILEERPPWALPADGTTLPQIPDDWALLHRMHSADVKDITDNSKIPGQPLKPKSLREGFGKNTKGREPLGATHATLLFRIAAGGSSGLLYAAAYREDDPRTRKYMKTAAGVLAVLAAMPQKDGWLSKRISEAGRQSLDVILLHMYDLPAYMTATVGDHATATMKTATNLGNEYNILNMLRTRDIKSMFPTPQLREAALRALDDPDNDHLWAQLTPKQSTFLTQEGIFNMHQRDKLETAGVSRDFQEDLLKHVLPRKTYQAWESARNNPNPTASSFTRPPDNPRIADLEAWAKANKLPAPIMDLAFVQSRHMGEVGRTLMKAQMVAEMKRIGLVIPATDDIPDGQSTIKVNGLGKMMAPKAVALALERMDKPNGDGAINGGVLRGIDDLRSWTLRTIMAWPLVHSLNMARSAMSMGFRGVVGTVQNLNAMKLGDPSTMRAAKYGLDLTGARTDYSADHQNAIEAMFNGLSSRTGGLGKAVFSPVGNFFGGMERGLWDHLVPSVGLTGFNIHLNKWITATDGAFKEGSPEFTAAAQRASAFGNTMMGKSSAVLRSPGLEYSMRQLFFAPSWFETRLKINLEALGEARGLMTGTMKLADVQYLPVKMRAMMISTAITWSLSKLLTGKPPQFNPQSEKYYAHTGIHDRNGRELGIDLNGYWSDDIKMFGDPSMYFMNRISPMLQYAHTVLTGRDVFGRVITDENLIDTGLGQLGPISTVTNAAARLYNSSGNMTDADKIKSAMEMSQIGSVSALPHVNELMNQKIAHRILRINGLPADDPDKIYELQQMITAAQKSHKNAFGKQMIDWIAKQKQAERSQSPRIPAAQSLWQHAKASLSTIGKATPVH